MTRKANPRSLGTASGQGCSISCGGAAGSFHRFLLVVTVSVLRTEGGDLPGEEVKSAAGRHAATLAIVRPTAYARVAAQRA